MKKIMALALAASMLSTSALAVTFDVGSKKEEKGLASLPADKVISKDGKTVNNLAGVKVNLKASDFTSWVQTEKTKADGTKYKEMDFGASNLTSDVKLQDFQFNADNFTVTYKVSKGANLVKKPAFDNKGNLVIEFGNQTVEDVTTNVPDVVVDFVEVKAKRTVKDIEGKDLVKAGERYRINLTNTVLETKNNKFVIAQTKATPATKMDAFELAEGMNKVEITKGEDGSMKKDVELYGSDYSLTTRVFANDVITFKTDAPKAEVLTALYAKNLDADLDTHTFVVDGFRAAVNMKLSVSDLGDVAAKDQVLYFMDETGKLTPCNWKYNADENVFEGKLPTGTTTIVNASKALTAAPVAASNEDKKPADSKKPAVPETGLVVNVDAAIVK